jgi:hypothetical protein
MALQRRVSLQKAQTILTALDKDERLNKYAKSSQLIVGSHQADKEHGYTLTMFNESKLPPNYSKQIIFCSDTKSGEILVYTGKIKECRAPFEPPNTPKRFRYGKYQDAVDYIVEVIETHMLIAQIH